MTQNDNQEEAQAARMFTGDEFRNAVALTVTLCVAGAIYLADPSPASDSLFANSGGIMVGFGLGVFATVLYVRAGGFSD